ncbi:MAG: D-glycerate dehydrogenase [Spirochaetia bacterium]
MSRLKVFVTRKIPQEGIDMLKEQCDLEIYDQDHPVPREVLIEKIRSCDGILPLVTDKIDAEVLDAAENLKGIANYAVGYNNIDINEATKRGIPVSNTPGVLTDATAETAWALLFASARRIVEADSNIRSDKWKGWGPLQFLGEDITGKTLGIVGAGRIGTAMAKKSVGFNMRVLYYDTRPNDILEKKLGAQRTDFSTLIGESDFISVHTPLIDETHHLFTLETFKQMKNSAHFINTSRGPIVKEADLLTALEEKLIAGAGIDVYEFEPEVTEGLKELPNVTITPHIGSATHGARTGMATTAARNLLTMLRGEEAPNCVNKEVYSR